MSLSMLVSAQDPNEGPGGGGGEDDVPDVPFDGGVSLLIAAGVGYGVRKVYEKRKQDRKI